MRLYVTSVSYPPQDCLTADATNRRMRHIHLTTILLWLWLIIRCEPLRKPGSGSQTQQQCQAGELYVGLRARSTTAQPRKTTEWRRRLQMGNIHCSLLMGLRACGRCVVSMVDRQTWCLTCRRINLRRPIWVLILPIVMVLS